MSKPEGETVVWITGATKGVGAGLASTVPYPGARVVNLSRSPAVGLENITFDLTSEAGWDRVVEHLRAELPRLAGGRAIFVHNAFLEGPYGYAGEVDLRAIRDHLIANAAAAIYLGNAFLTVCPPDVDGGLVMISSLAAKLPMEGNAAYSASKAAIEMWVRTVGIERRHRGGGPWVTAFRLGLVESPGIHTIAAVDPRDCPAGAATRDSIARGEPMPAATAGAQMWDIVTAGPRMGHIYEVGTLPTTIKDY